MKNKQKIGWSYYSRLILLSLILVLGSKSMRKETTLSFFQPVQVEAKEWPKVTSKAYVIQEASETVGLYEERVHQLERPDGKGTYRGYFGSEEVELSISYTHGNPNTREVVVGIYCDRSSVDRTTDYPHKYGVFPCFCEDGRACVYQCGR